MKIVSQFSDYYDNVGKKFYPPNSSSVEFHRKTAHCGPSQLYRVKEKLSQEKVESIKFFSNHNEKWSITFFALGFCGQLYRGAQIELPDTVEVSYTLTGIAYIPSQRGVKIPEEIQDNAKKHFAIRVDCCRDVCQEIGEPSFIILPGSFQNIQVIKNPNLSSFHFHKMMNSYDVFHKAKTFLEEQKEERSKKKSHLEKGSNNIWQFNPFISAFLTVK
jgi:hypothetical protein